MRKPALIASLFTIAILTLQGCSQTPRTEEMKENLQHPSWSYDATIYELNTRQLTAEGTLKAAEGQLERLRDLGIDIIWIMPVQPIGVKERKGTMGSYYAIQDYTAVNPELGTAEDFKSFVDKAHSLGIKILLDWVANHTSPDAVWTSNQGWHKYNERGELAVKYDWTDIAELEFDNYDMRAAMIEAMKYWVREMDVDGFRCDMAMLVPLDFWREAKRQLLDLKEDLFMLAEAEETYLVNDVFDMYYSWKLHHMMNAVAQGRENAKSLWRLFGDKAVTFPKKAIPMVFTSNHDENSHSNTEFVRMGDAAETFAAFTYLVPSMPLIYTGQELGNVKRLEFFEKDNLEPNQPEKYTSLYSSLNTLRKNNPALWSGEKGADMLRISNNRPEQVFSLKRIGEDNEVIAIFNLSPWQADVTFDDVNMDGIFTDFSDGSQAEMSNLKQLSLNPWEYRIYTR